MAKHKGIEIRIKGIIDEDFVNYKEPSMTIMMPKCDFKCDRECGSQVCQNSDLAAAPDILVDVDKLIRRYGENDITKAIVFQGLEPMDTFFEMYTFISRFRDAGFNDPIIIYTGYYESEIWDKLQLLKNFGIIYIKVGRYIPNQEQHYDPYLGVKIYDPQYTIDIRRWEP